MKRFSFAPFALVLAGCGGGGGGSSPEPFTPTGQTYVGTYAPAGGGTAIGTATVSFGGANSVTIDLVNGSTQAQERIVGAFQSDGSFSGDDSLSTVSPSVTGTVSVRSSQFVADVRVSMTGGINSYRITASR